jgi:large subunit ribosomal protein L10
MSKPVKNLITEEYRRRFADLDGCVVIDIRGVNALQNNDLRAGLLKEQVRVTVVKNSLAKSALTGTAMEKLGELLEGPCALAYGGESVVNIARSLIARVKEIQALEVKGAIMEGELFTADQMEALSKYPTRAEAQAQVIQVVLGPAGQVIGAAVGAGNAIASILKAMEEKLEKGEAISKVG